MLIVRLVVTLKQIDLCLQAFKSTPIDDLHVRKNLHDHQKVLSAIFSTLLSGVPNTESYFSLLIVKSESTDNVLGDAKKLLKTLHLNDDIHYQLSVLDLVEKFLNDYLRLIKPWFLQYQQAYTDIINTLQANKDDSLLWVKEELSALDDLLKPAIPSIADIQKIALNDNLQALLQVITKLIFMHWPGIIQSLTKTAVNRALYEKMLAAPLLAKHFMVILEIPVQVEKTLTECVDLDVNISKLRDQKNWKLAKRARELIALAPALFHHADTRKKTFIALQDLIASQDGTPSERSEVETALKAIFSHEIDNKPAVVDIARLDSPMSRYRSERELAIHIQRASEPPLHLQLEPHDNRHNQRSCSSDSDSLILRTNDSPQTVRARFFNASSSSSSPDAITKAAAKMSCGNSRLDPIVREGFKEFLLELQAKQTKELELQYIEQLNRESLREFYVAVCSKFQAAYVGYLALASGKVQVANNVNGYCGSLLKLLSSALGPIGGVIFATLGEAVRLVSQRRTVIDATKISYLGTLESANKVIEQFARKLTLQYELQIRLLKVVEEDESKTHAGSTFFKLKQFFGGSLELLKNAKLLAEDDSPPSMLADYVVAMIFGNLLLMDKVPSKPDEFADFLPTILHNGPLLAMDNENKLFNALGFFHFKLHHSIEQWHAIDIFRAPRIAVQDKNGKIEYWKSHEEKNENYLWRMGSREEAQAMRYIMQPTAQALSK